MNRKSLLISAMLLLSIIATASCAETATITNYCKVGKCTKCKKAESGVKSCDTCIFSAKKLVDNINTDVFQCVEKGSIKNCKLYYDHYEDAQETGCKECAEGNFMMTTFVDNLVTKMSCHENPIKDMIKLPFCKTRSVAMAGLTAFTKCDECKVGFIPNSSGVCVPFTIPTPPIANCAKYTRNGEVITCAECDLSFNLNASSTECVTWGIHTGCAAIVNSKCDQCNTDKNYYAVDVDDIKGQICSKATFVYKILALMLAGLALLL